MIIFQNQYKKQILPRYTQRSNMFRYKQNNFFDKKLKPNNNGLIMFATDKSSKSGYIVTITGVPQNSKIKLDGDIIIYSSDLKDPIIYYFSNDNHCYIDNHYLKVIFDFYDAQNPQSPIDTTNIYLKIEKVDPIPYNLINNHKIKSRMISRQ